MVPPVHLPHIQKVLKILWLFWKSLNNFFHLLEIARYKFSEFAVFMNIPNDCWMQVNTSLKVRVTSRKNKNVLQERAGGGLGHCKHRYSPDCPQPLHGDKHSHKGRNYFWCNSRSSKGFKILPETARLAIALDVICTPVKTQVWSFILLPDVFVQTAFSCYQH